MLDKENPCRGCTKRYVGCHSKCEDRKVFLEKYYALKEKIENEKKKTRDFDDYIFTVMDHSKIKRERAKMRGYLKK